MNARDKGMWVGFAITLSGMVGLGYLGWTKGIKPIFDETSKAVSREKSEEDFSEEDFYREGYIGDMRYIYREVAGFSNNRNVLTLEDGVDNFTLIDSEDNHPMNWQSGEPIPIGERVEEITLESISEGETYIIKRAWLGDPKMSVNGQYVRISGKLFEKIFTFADRVYEDSRLNIAAELRGDTKRPMKAMKIEDFPLFIEE